MINTDFKIGKDSILVFEYFTASGDFSPDIRFEAESLILSLIDDLKNLDIILIIHKSYKYLLNDYKKIKTIFIREPIDSWLEENAKYFNKSIFIAAENDMNLYNLCKILEKNNIKIYNSSKKASYISSNKYDTYSKFKGKIHQPETFKIKIDQEKEWINEIKNIYEKLNKKSSLKDFKVVIKPINGVDCENIKIIDNLEESLHDIDESFPNNSYILIQEYIEGIDISVSLISNGEKAIPLSLNKQEIILNKKEERYLGGYLPFESELKDEVFKIAIKVVQSIEGIKGFVGVDLILNEDVYFLEINSRFTTPYVALQKIANFNIAESIIDLLDNKLTIEDLEKKISFNGSVKFKKEEDLLNLEIYK